MFPRPHPGLEAHPGGLWHRQGQPPGLVLSLQVGVQRDWVKTSDLAFLLQHMLFLSLSLRSLTMPPQTSTCSKVSEVLSGVWVAALMTAVENPLVVVHIVCLPH